MFSSWKEPSQFILQFPYGPYMLKLLQSKLLEAWKLKRKLMLSLKTEMW